MPSVHLPTVEALKAFVQKQRSEQKTVAWTNGCFDILHPGHLETFEFAKQCADVLIVGMNADSSPYFRTKPGRPIHNEPFRIRMLQGLRDVDAVFVFEDETPIVPILAILPDVLVKGGDYGIESVVGAQEVLANGGRVEIVPTVSGYSTTGTVKKILQTYR